MNTLIVEDSPHFRRCLHEMLAAAFPSMQISEASDGYQALDQVRCTHPDLVFMDIRLPGPSGLELTQEVKKIQSPVIVIIVTSHDDLEFREMAAKAGADHFFRKDDLNEAALTVVLKSIFGDRCLH